MELTTATHQTATTELVEADGIEFAYRRFGRRHDANPLVLLQHFRGNLDNWDPAFTDLLADEREIILVDPPGVGASAGAPKRTVAETARSILGFLEPQPTPPLPRHSRVYGTGQLTGPSRPAALRLIRR